ncbi:MAG: ATP-dependent DNA helicase [Pseudomonadota bacterium]
MSDPGKDYVASGSGALDRYPVMVLSGVSALIAPAGGETESVDATSALERLSSQPHLVCHSAFLVRRLAFVCNAGSERQRACLEQRHLDLAELFAFVLPATFGLPTPDGLARALGFPAGERNMEPTGLLRRCARSLLGQQIGPHYRNIRETAQMASFLERTNWPWARLVLAALEASGAKFDTSTFGTGLNVWDRLPDWDEGGPRPQPGSAPVTGEEAIDTLKRMLGSDAEVRLEQQEYAAQVAQSFAPIDVPKEGRIILSEAGTGLGKTLGYLSPASVWAEKNSGTAWISTYTKNLQRQLEQETARLYPDPAERAHHVVVRKGRENYVCLLNLQERFGRLNTGNAKGALLAALISRWVRYSKDGDMVGGDFPAWLLTLFNDLAPGGGQQLSPQSLGLTDRRGECIYSACPHYRKCFVEKAGRASRKARIVVANHALVMVQAALESALGTPETEDEQTASGGIRRLVLDEGHHLFDAADSAFAGHLTGLEASELRRWLRGPETRGRRGRSLRDRLGDLAEAGDGKELELVREIAGKANELPGPGWQNRIAAGAPDGAAEHFLTHVRTQVQARTNEGMYNLETDCRPPVPEIIEASETLKHALIRLAQPMKQLAEILIARLADEASELDTAERARLDSISRGLRRRAELTLSSWTGMLDQLKLKQADGFVDWFAIETAWGREIDVGMHSHWIDPTIPFSETVLENTDGVLITSATLKDRPPDLPDDWRNAEMRTGAAHLAFPVSRFSHDSPFDYPDQARIIVVNDVNRNSIEQVAAAYRELFLASRGGALGLFTAIFRLRETYKQLAGPLAGEGISLFAQHVDPVDTGTLVDLFRAETNSCLLGTDAVRDGVDVPGEALRLIVLDRVPWPQPNILHRARQKAFGGSTWTDMLVRLKLRQAFGRLIRNRKDRGVFVVLDSRLATRFTTAFPVGVEIERTGLVEAIEATREFLQPTIAASGPSD